MSEYSKNNNFTGFFRLPQSRTLAGKVADKIETGLLFFAAGAFVIIGILIVNQVFFRYILSAPPMWTEELTRYVFVWLAWLSTAVVFRRGQHITVDAISNIIPKKLKLFHDILIRGLCVLIVLYLFYYHILCESTSYNKIFHAPNSVM